jgi:polyribonucleotide nucleotidyltransferase
MDIKISGLSREIMAEALAQAHAGRLEILDHMGQTLAEPRKELSPFAPRMLTVKINPDKIGAVIGKGGANIRSLEETYEVAIDIQDDGTIFVAGVDGVKAEAAVERIAMLTTEPEPGQVFTGKVVRITDFGAFVELLPGLDGMVHISQLSPEHLRTVEEAVKMGDEVMVMVTDVSDEGKIRLSRRAVLEGWSLEEARAQDAVRKGGGGPGGGRDRDRGGRDRGRGDGRNGRDRDRNRDRGRGDRR